MRKEEGIEWSGLVKKMASKNSQNICNKRKQQSKDMSEQRKKIKIKIVITRRENTLKIEAKLIITLK